MVGIRVGVIDDENLVAELKPQTEIYTERKPAWLGKIEGAEQRDANYQLVEEK